MLTNKNRKTTRKKITTILTFTLGLMLICSPLAFVRRVEASGTITGVVYVDYNMNGAPVIWRRCVKRKA